MSGPLQNRVTPWGDIVAHPARGTLMGNRGILHDNDRKLGRARWRGRRWIACLLEFGDRAKTGVMKPRHYTELFFTDDCVALAAGHRPCAECRRADWRRFRDAMGVAMPDLGPVPGAEAVDARLHAARTGGGDRPRAMAPDLPEGAMAELADGSAVLRWADGWHRWSWDGYTPCATPDGEITVLTPAPALAALRAGYRPANPAL